MNVDANHTVVSLRRRINPALWVTVNDASPAISGDQAGRGIEECREE